MSWFCENVGSPAVAGKCFRLFSGDGVGWDPCGEDNKKVHKSDAGSMCSSSLVSDHQSSSYEGDYFIYVCDVMFFYFV